MNILNSATRIALLLVIGSLAGLTCFIVVKNSSDQTVITAITGLFSTTVVAITSFYFGQKQNVPTAEKTAIADASTSSPESSKESI